MPLLLFGAYLFRDILVLSAPMGLASVVLPMWTMLEYRHFARTDPKRLHSEEYLLAQQRLMIQSKSSTQLMDASLLPMSENPEMNFEEQISDIPHIDEPAAHVVKGGQ
ncbi:hypothetical protein CXP35_12475 [Komagataeibacter xylinus]|nr:hypothetical protein CXP35_12475 [Komagataeibacter xylinus]